ncbi:hypothetical protein [Corynebacterium crudilactis]|uniref:Uncharacterized protein n=1 Tax=Corynebacterium crudilactis TaxID=1652495 RepID=A0A172QTU5_9CORY|nr:hypothetical protein [Corynebacterium crudilactis]ANE04068.1 hypothetical protein ccrud_07520 [Corynebacterium crudilactis]
MLDVNQFCMYSRGHKTSGFRFTGPSPSLDFLLIDIIGKWNAFSRVAKKDGSSLPFPDNVCIHQGVVGAVRQCLFQAMVAKKWSLFSSITRAVVANLPDVLTMPELQEWAQPVQSYELVGYCALSPGWPGPISSVFEKTDLELWESTLATSWMMLGPYISGRHAHQMPVENFYWRHNTELRWCESFANGCFDDLTSLQKLLSLLLSKRYLSQDYLLVRVLKINE